MSHLDLSAVWNPDPARRSAGARLRGSIRLSFRQLRHRFLESLLILLGIAVGVGVLTGMGGFLRFLGAFENETLLLQPELTSVTVRPRSFDMSQLYGLEAEPAIRIGPELAEPIQLTTEDILAAREQLTNAAAIIGSRGGSSSTPISAVDGHPFESELDSPESMSALLLRTEWVTPDELAFRGRTLIAGRSFTWEDYAEGRAVIVLEQEGAERLFPGLEPAEVIGRSVSTLGGSPRHGAGWQIVGIVAKEELSPLLEAMRFQGNREVTGYIPHTAQQNEPLSLSQIGFAPVEEGSVGELIAEVELFFAQRHGPDSVTVSNPAETLRAFNQNQRSVTLTLMSLAALALLVAAINILNLFTARVIRRRRLAAMSVALGAERRSLFGATLTEAVLLGVGGSLIGLLPAYGVITLLKSLLLSDMAGAGEALRQLFSVTLTVPDVLLGLAAGVGTSLLFGLYPAYLSASVDPAEGLRRE